MEILLVNDDGYKSEALNKLKEIGKNGCVFIVHDVSIIIQSLLDLRINLLQAQYP